MKGFRGDFGLWGAILACVLGAAIWLMAVFRVNVAVAAPLDIPGSLASLLAADYSADEGPRSFRIINLNVIGEALQDLGFTPSQADEEKLAWAASLQEAVPTATALNFHGDAPLTATPTNTATPTPTFTPTATYTPTATATKVPTATPKPTKTKAPTSTPKPAEPKDVTNPEVRLDGDFVITPTLGELVETVETGKDYCPVQVNVENVTIFDPALTFGIEWVKMKYEVPGYISLTYSDSLSKCCGGMDGEDWLAQYSGGFEVKIKLAWEDPVTLKVYVKVKDKAGNYTMVPVGEYQVSCTE